MTTIAPTITRKEIAQMLGPNVSVRMVGRNERLWGLHSARVKFKTRCILYYSARVITILGLDR
jgi:hypothetical protein